MPWKIMQQDGKHCVVKKDTEETVKCHPTRSEAVEHMQALYANEGVSKSLIEIEKCYYPDGPWYFSATSFEEAEAIEQAAEKERQIMRVFDKFMDISRTIIHNPEIEDKVGKLDSLVKELAERVQETSEYEIEKGEDGNGISKSVEVGLFKSDPTQRLIYGAVLVPGRVDSQGDLADEGTIEEAAHNFFRKSRIMDYQHQIDLDPSIAEPVESYIMPVAATVNGKLIKKGTWILVSKIHDDAIWDQVQKGEILSYSIRGMGRRIPLEEPEIETA